MTPSNTSESQEESRRYTLATQFVAAASVVLVAGMLIIGFWVTSEIEEGVTRNSASSTALYMESIVAPAVQELAYTNMVSPKTRLALDKILRNSELGRRIVSFKIWKEGGLIAYSSRPSIIGRTFPVTPNLRGAWAGQVTAEFDTLVDEEDALERASGKPLLEMYSPIRERSSGRIIAVAEFYETAPTLKENLFRAKLQSWMVVAGVTLVMFAALWGIVLRGSRTIEQQRSQLQGRVRELSTLLSQNEGLRSRLQSASFRVAEINERYLRRIGADLHDGPAQSLALALLRLDAIRNLIPKVPADDPERNDIDVVQDALREAIREIREISAGLTLAKLEEISPSTILKEIVGAHQKRTGSKVSLEVQSVPASLQMPFKIAMFRFVQETLNNTYRHAGDVDVRVACRVEGPELVLEVSDRGPGFTLETVSGSESGLGLIGLRERIESLGGTLTILSEPGEGARVTMRCRI